jgi:hypothetical protein
LTTGASLIIGDGVKRRFARLAIVFVPAVVLGACVSQNGPTTTYTAYRLTCCSQTDIEAPWRPGTTFDLHLIPTSDQVTTVNPIHAVRITGILSGPFADVATLKQGGRGPNQVAGASVSFDDRVSQSSDSVMTFVLPAGLPVGLYSLNLRWDFGGQSSDDSGTVVRVGS